jgi:N-dimethylarginine dimethylaminohydrolase
MISLNVNNEFGKLNEVILGIAQSNGGVPKLDECYDPKSREHVQNGTFPEEAHLSDELNQFLNVLKKYNVSVFRPTLIEDYNQIFSRDIAFVIGEKLVVSNIIKDREKEINAIENIISQINPSNIIRLSNKARIEGGDVIIHNDHIFIGYSKEEDFKQFQVARTNEIAIEEIKENFSNKKIVAFELKKSDDQAKENALHLDCCFQPIGENKAIISPEGFRNKSDVNELIKLFGDDNVLLVTSKEMSNMYTNVFSISKNIIISDPRFIRLNEWLEKNDFTVEKVAYKEISKMGGLFRCSTLPLLRE